MLIIVFVHAVHGTLPLYKKASEYDQEILLSQNADKPIAPKGRATPQSGDTICHGTLQLNKPVLDTCPRLYLIIR